MDININKNPYRQVTKEEILEELISDIDSLIESISYYPEDDKVVIWEKKLQFKQNIAENLSKQL